MAHGVVSDAVFGSPCIYDTYDGEWSVLWHRFMNDAKSPRHYVFNRLPELNARSSSRRSASIANPVYYTHAFRGNRLAPVDWLHTYLIIRPVDGT